MAKIRQNKEQENALLTIRAKIEMVVKINTALSKEGPFAISVSGTKGASAIQLDEALNTKAKALFKAQKERLAKDIAALAKKYDIELDDDEQATLA